MTSHTSPKLSQLIKRARELDAEHRVLDLYDDARHALPDDYGNGQRHHELVRVRRESERANADARVYGANASELESSQHEQLLAYERIATKRTKRYAAKREGYRNATAMHAMSAWRSVKRTIESGSSSSS